MRRDELATILLCALITLALIGAMVQRRPTTDPAIIQSLMMER